jgi:hypothetical protein
MRRGANATEAALADWIIAQAREVEGAEFPISFRSLKLWQQVYYAIGDDAQIRGVEALIDHRGEQPAGGGAHEARSPQAVEYFYSVYHVQRGPTIKTCHGLTLRKARKEGWNWPASYAATLKWLDKYNDLALLVTS